MVDNSKLFGKYTFNNKVEAPSLLSVAPMTLFGSNVRGTIWEEEKEFLKIRAINVGLYILGATWTSLEGLAFDK